MVIQVLSHYDHHVHQVLGHFDLKRIKMFIVSNTTSFSPSMTAILATEGECPPTYFQPVGGRHVVDAISTMLEIPFTQARSLMITSYACRYYGITSRDIIFSR